MTTSLGFLCVRHHAEYGYFGGLLSVNRLARPLEFHCTVAVKPSRAQQLLYGPTIDDFVAGEQIAKALVTKAKVKCELVLTDTPSVMAIGQISKQAVAMVKADHSSAPGLRIPGSVSDEWQLLNHPRAQLLLNSDSDQLASSLPTLLEDVSPNFDFSEPFLRVAEALMEAHPVARAA